MRKLTLAALVLAGCSSSYQEAPRRTLEENPAVVETTATVEPKTETPAVETPKTECESATVELCYTLDPVVSGLFAGYCQKGGMNEIGRVVAAAKIDTNRDGRLTMTEMKPHTQGITYKQGPSEVTYVGKIQVEKGATLEGLTLYQKAMALEAAQVGPLSALDIKDIKSLE